MTLLLETLALLGFQNALWLVFLILLQSLLPHLLCRFLSSDIFMFWILRPLLFSLCHCTHDYLTFVPITPKLVSSAQTSPLNSRYRWAHIHNNPLDIFLVIQWHFKYSPCPNVNSWSNLKPDPSLDLSILIEDSPIFQLLRPKCLIIFNTCLLSCPTSKTSADPFDYHFKRILRIQPLGTLSFLSLLSRS